jgi:predicted phage terminase large subunit-like protein
MSRPSSITPGQALRLGLRADFSAFVEMSFRTLNPGEPFARNWHLEAMAHALDRVRRGESKRLIITVPPRHLKSITTAVAFPAWMLGLDPTLKFMAASYGSELAAKHSRDFRTVMQSTWYRETFPGTRLKRNTEADVETQSGGARKAMSLDGAGTGFGADIIIVDDLMKAGDASSAAAREKVQAYYNETLLSRLNNKQEGRIVCIQQRLHEDDLVGFLLEKGGFEHLNLPAIAEQDEIVPLGHGRSFARRHGEALFTAREPLQVLEVLRLEMGVPVFSAQYQQNPVAPESNLIRWHKIQTYEEAPPRNHFHQVVQSWDTSTTSKPGSDYSVGTTWGFLDDHWLLLDLFRQKLEFPELESAVRGYRDKWRAEVILIEDANSGTPLVQGLMRDIRRERQRSSWKPLAIRPEADKVTRLSAQGAKLESGFARFPNNASWMADLKRELVGFPNTRHDDQVDSVSQFLKWAGAPRRANLGRD